MNTPIAHRTPAASTYLCDRVLLMMRRQGLSVRCITHAHARVIDHAGAPMPALLSSVGAWLHSLTTIQLTRLIDALSQAHHGKRFAAPYPHDVLSLVNIACTAIEKIDEHPNAVERMAAYDDVGQAVGRSMEATMPEAAVQRARAHAIAPLEN